MLLNYDWKQTNSGRVRLCEDGIIHVEINPGFEQSRDDAIENLSAALSHCVGIRRPILVDVRGTKPLRSETRLVYTEMTISKAFLALAMVTLKDRLSRGMINFYFQVAGLQIPTRMFDDPDRAREWLVEKIPGHLK